jgi:hypothetical protein
VFLTKYKDYVAVRDKLLNAVCHRFFGLAGMVFMTVRSITGLPALFYARSQNWKATTRIVMSCLSVCPSIRTEQLGSHRTNFYEIRYLSIFLESFEKNKFSLKSYKNNEYFACRPKHIFPSYLAQFFLEWEIFQTKVVEKIKTHILCSITFFSKTVPFMKKKKKIL